MDSLLNQLSLMYMMRPLCNQPSPDTVYAMQAIYTKRQTGNLHLDFLDLASSSLINRIISALLSSTRLDSSSFAFLRS